MVPILARLAVQVRLALRDQNLAARVRLEQHRMAFQIGVLHAARVHILRCQVLPFALTAKSANLRKIQAFLPAMSVRVELFQHQQERKSVSAAQLERFRILTAHYVFLARSENTIPSPMELSVLTVSLAPVQPPWVRSIAQLANQERLLLTQVSLLARIVL